MTDDVEVWRPGSFTKNFSWGPANQGLVKLHSEIRAGFQNEVTDVPRGIFRERVRGLGRPDYIPLNFFLYNRIHNGVDFVVYDELVFQALNYPHSGEFDRLALFAFNLSYVGVWRTSKQGQDRPALWANAYVRERIAGKLQWDMAAVSADDIQNFVTADPRYDAETSRKLATNLNYLYRVGGMAEFKNARVKRWWVNALFLALDRLVMDRSRRNLETRSNQLSQLLASAGFINLTGPRSIEKELAVKHLVHLYETCGRIGRFSEESVREMTTVMLPDMQDYIQGNIPNDLRPGGAVHNTNPIILKTIPRVCAHLAVHAGFDFLDANELDNFDVDIFVRRKAEIALSRLKEKGIHPNMSAADLMKLTRER